MDKEAYQKSLTKQKRKGKTSLCCVICGEDDSSVIEMHHVYGRSNSDQVQPLCKNCHAKITKEQNKVSPKSRSSNASNLEKIAYQLITIGALLKEFAEQLINLGHEVINYVQNCSSGIYAENREA